MIIIRVQSDSDYQKCLKIRKEVFLKEQKVPEHLEVKNEENSQHFLVKWKDQPAATGRFRIYGFFLKFERIATLPSMRNKGIAKKLLLEMQKIAAEEYEEYLPYLNSQASAIGFYQKLGWVPVGKRFIDANIEHQAMILPPKNPSKLLCLQSKETPQEIIAILTR